MPRQLFGYGRSDRSSKLTRGLLSETPAGFRSRQGDGHDRTPIAPHNALFPSYKTPPVHHAARRHGGGVAGRSAGAAGRADAARPYICPSGKVVHTTGTVHDGNTLRYRASKFDCEVCALKMQCCPNGPAPQIPRDVHEYARDVTRRLMRTKAFLNSRDQRKRVEMRFAHLKIYHGFERMRLRGLSGARDEFLPAATVQNLKTLALRLLGQPPARRRASFA